MAEPAYAIRSLGDGERWGQEVQKSQRASDRELGLIRDEVLRSRQTRAGMTAQISALTSEVDRISGELQRANDRLSLVEDIAQQSRLDIMAMRNELRNIDVE